MQERKQWLNGGLSRVLAEENYKMADSKVAAMWWDHVFKVNKEIKDGGVKDGHRGLHLHMC